MKYEYILYCFKYRNSTRMYQMLHFGINYLSIDFYNHNISFRYTACDIIPIKCIIKIFYRKNNFNKRYNL